MIGLHLILAYLRHGALRDHGLIQAERASLNQVRLMWHPFEQDSTTLLVRDRIWVLYLL